MISDKKSNCSDCATLLRKDPSFPDIEIEESTKEAQEFKETCVSLVSRGGLVKPSGILNIICEHCWHLKQLIFDGDSIEKVLTAAHKPRAVLIECFQSLIL